MPDAPPPRSDRSYDQACPIARTLDILGDRWTLLIIRDMFMGVSRFKGFLDHSPGLPSTILSQRLKRLEQHGLVDRFVYSQHPLRAEYHLTQAGRSLEPVIRALAAWGFENTLSSDEQQRFLEVVGGDVARDS